MASGSVDVGIGVLAAARALDIEFIPLLRERYDLVIPREHYDDPLLAPVLEVLQDPDFANQVESMGGYDVAEMGQIATEIGR